VEPPKRLDPLIERRIRQFKAVGGVEIEPDDKAQEALIHIGVAEHNRAVFSFECPVCGRVERGNTDMEPMCTGPGWTDDHEPEVMFRRPRPSA